MRSPHPAPSLVPADDVSIHLILDDFGALGKAYRETHETNADAETVVRNLLRGEYAKPLRVIAFNTAEGWSRDVSEDIAWEVLERIASAGTPMPEPTRTFLEFHVGRDATAKAEHAIL